MTSARLALACVLLLAGCTSDRAEQREEQRQREESWTFDVPVPLPSPDGWRIQPITVTGTRTVTETRTGQITARTEYHAPELGAAIATALRQSFPALGAVMGPPPAPKGGLSDGGVWGTAATGATGAAWLLSKIMRDRSDAKTDADWERERKAAEERAEAAGYHRGRAEVLAKATDA